MASPTAVGATHQMQDIERIWTKYDDNRLFDRLESLDDVHCLVQIFCKDVAETFRLITLLPNRDRNPSLYCLSDAPIVGLLIRIAKLLRLACRFYEIGNGDYLSVFSRPLVESAVVAIYLLRAGDEAVEDFRRCSYKDTLRILRDHESGSQFFETPAGQRVLRSALDDLALEGLSKDSFAQQKSNRWRIQGKSLYEIFAEVVGPDEFPFVYGMMSESIHGSWNESMDWCLVKNDDGTFSANPFFIKVDARYLLPLVKYTTPAYALWIERTRPCDDSLRSTLDRIQAHARTIYFAFDDLYDGVPDASVSTDLS